MDIALSLANHHGSNYPSVLVRGNDLSPIQPFFVPPNCTFEVDNFEEWNLPYKFDLIHGRELDGSISNCEELCRGAFEHLKPGGYFELKSLEHGFLSVDETHKKAVHALEWQQHVIEGRDKLKKPFCGATTCAQGMKNAGFVNIKIQKFKGHGKKAIN
ncbi:predicted protein [Histoplasma mississippiense (nom. inval.)]|uniref:predicted protein n=1 Tax=Ajellomyces capsulatus (strain NAm1 / WU24) TaxID=2059318 RepID=UPI000157CB11|nr:predicted protein [Histoplasma mississippiense (nom. inval.)]EDN09144.1 predicted protein [Histoplasma mississippiense (nom. inval.)]